jgi:hypothetical protein
MGLTIELLRPDDLLTLTIEAQNLLLDATDPKNPVLVVDDSSQPAYLVVNFAPQHVIEKAYFETGNVTADPPYNHVPTGTPPLGTTDDPLDPAGEVPARIAGPSRLVFQLPKKLTSIPFQTASLLDWSQLKLIVSPVALGKPLPPPITRPGPLETALELPYRLVLSPGNDVGWVNAQRPVTHAGRTELWHTRLAKIVKVTGKNGVTLQFEEASSTNLIPLRAIWSPDFVDHGNLPSHDLDQTPFLASLSPRDRAQLVILTSGTTGYYVVLAGGGTSPWTPSPIDASRLFLSALGGWLSSRGTWSPPPDYDVPILRRIPPKPVIPRPVSLKPTSRKSLASKLTAPKIINSSVSHEPIEILYKTVALDLAEWDHLATQGRDQYVKVVYDGYLYPFGHAASLVKVTERKFVPADTDGSVPSSVTAYLRQHMYIVVREVKKSYKAAPYAYQGRENPFRSSIRVDTVITPDIDEPPLDGKPGYFSGNSFWINVGDAPFQFHMTAVDLAGAKVDFLAPMIFVSVSETNVGAVPPGVSDASSVQVNYLLAGSSRLCDVRGKKVAYANPGAGDTVLKSSGLLFDAQILSPSPQGEVPFIPLLSQGNIVVPSLEELLGTSSPVSIQYYQPYLTSDMDSNAGVFAVVATGSTALAAPPPVAFSANKAGGFATPSFTITALTARKGIVAGSPDDAARGYIDPSAYFGGLDITAELFGTIPLGQLIPIDAITKLAASKQNSPEVRSLTLPNKSAPTQIVTRVKWEPELQDYSIGPVKIAFNSDGQTSKLSLNATITRPLDGSLSQSSVKGTLSKFEITLLGVVALVINSIEFTSNNGSKTNVIVKLAGKNAIQFIGPLTFMQKLADILPPGLFGGEGPSIDLTSTGIRVSYTLGLPSISIGVFSLQNIAIMAGVDLPYLNGEPGFEFAFCSRGSPFLLTVECIGGGGYVHLILTAKGIQLVEGALEFGGEFSFDVGVASGGVHIMAGIYFKLAGSTTTLTGFVDIGGEVSVLGIISISIDLNLSLTWVHSSKGNKIQGRATLKISISILFFSISVSISVERSFGSGAGDPQIAQVMDANDWVQYCLAFGG